MFQWPIRNDLLNNQPSIRGSGLWTLSNVPIITLNLWKDLPSHRSSDWETKISPKFGALTWLWELLLSITIHGECARKLAAICGSVPVNDLLFIRLHTWYSVPSLILPPNEHLLLLQGGFIIPQQYRGRSSNRLATITCASISRLVAVPPTWFPNPST